MEKKIKFAVIGFGHIGKRHCEMITRNNKTELIAIADTNKTLEEEAKKKYGVMFYANMEHLLSKEKGIDIVCICTPNGLHAKQALLVLNKEKHVVIEKPMALTKADCEKVIHRSLEVSKKVFCIMQNRYSPPSAWIKKVMDQKRLGKIYMAQINCYWNRDERYYKKEGWKGKEKLDGGTLYTQFSHFIDTIYWLFGDVSNIVARFADFNHKRLTDFEDSGIISFQFKKGGIGSINYSTAVFNENLESSLTVIGEKGSIKIGGQYMEKVEYCNIQGYKMPKLPPSNPANDYGPYKGSAANHNYVFSNVVETLTGQSSMTTNALEGLKVVEIIERIYEIKKQKFKK